MYQVGVGTADITPPVGLPLSGFAMRMNRPSVAIDDPLLVKALVIQTDSETCLLLSYDLLGFDFALDAALRGTLVEAFGERFSPGGVILTTTHTHSGPPTMPISGETRVPESYVHHLCAATRAATAQALASLADAGLFHAETEVQGLTLNRRGARLEDDPASGTPKKEFALDRSLDLFVFKSRDGTCLAGLVRFACHAVTMTTQHFSADFPGELTRRLAARLGATCLFLEGTAGDTNPVIVSRDHAAMLGFVDQLMAQLEDLPNRLQPVAPGTLRLTQRAFTLPFAPFPSQDVLLERIARNERILAGDLTSLDIQPLVAEYAAWRRAEDPDVEGAVRHWAEVYNGSIRRTLQASISGSPTGAPFHAARLMFGPVCLLFLTGEILTPVGQHIQALAPQQALRVISYLSPIVGYIADAEDFRLGGYEATNAWVWYGMPGPFREESEAVILDQVREMLR
jgi:neutral ceramidase